MDCFTSLWKGHWPPLSNLDLSPLLRPLLPWEEDWESTGVGDQLLLLKAFEMCVQSIFWLPSVAPFLELQESRTV